MAQGRVPTVVVASDAFKGSLNSLEVADAVRLGLLDEVPSASVRVVAVADGGEGTVAAALAAGWTGVPVQVHGPTGEPVTATVAVSRPGTGAVRALSAAAPEGSSAAAHDTAALEGSSATADDPAAPEGSSAAAHDTAALEGSSATADDPAALERSRGESREQVLVHGRGGSDPVTALVELADACGLERLPGGVPAPLTASSRGLGEVIRAALDLGADEVVVGIGGSASTDGGAGMLAALGARVLDADGRELPDGGAALARVARLDLSALDRRLAGIRLVLAADVDNPLLGPRGAAAVYAPQKGATPEDVATLEAALTSWADAVEQALAPDDAVPESTNRSHQGQQPVPTSTNRSQQEQQPGAGAAGGVGFALLAVLRAERRSGVDVVLDLVGLEAALANSDLLVTGEGALDEQTLAGKAVSGVARRARAHDIPVVAVCGRRSLDDDGLASLGVQAAYPLSDLEPEPQRSIANAAILLRRNGRRVAKEWLSGPPE